VDLGLGAGEILVVSGGVGHGDGGVRLVWALAPSFSGF
jgi:hypothetical protein